MPCLQVRQVDLVARTIRLDPGTTKNGEGREVVMRLEVEELLRAAVAEMKPKGSVFTREDGKPIKDFRGAWRNLCVRAGTGRWEYRQCGAAIARVKCECGGVRKYVGLIPHSFQRSAAKAARCAGVSESVIMAMGGWKTPSMFRRYAIVSSADQRATVEMIPRERAEKALSSRSAPPVQ
jgi:integrase